MSRLHLIYTHLVNVADDDDDDVEKRGGRKLASVFATHLEHNVTEILLIAIERLQQLQLLAVQ